MRWLARSIWPWLVLLGPAGCAEQFGAGDPSPSGTADAGPGSDPARGACNAVTCEALCRSAGMAGACRGSICACMPGPTAPDAGDASSPPDDGGSPPPFDGGDATPPRDDGDVPLPPGPTDGGTPCDGMTCSGHGTCELTSFLDAPVCRCDPGYLLVGTTTCIDEARWGCRDAAGDLVPRGTARCGTDDSIVEVCRDATGAGRMEWSWGADCNPGTTCSGGCLTAPCSVQPCPLETTCLDSLLDGAPSACVVTCDCSNCGNCDASDFADSAVRDPVRSCGNDWGAPTIACNRPCPSAGDGCLPLAPGVGICVPSQGCFSASW